MNTNMIGFRWCSKIKMRPFALDESSLWSGRVNTNGTYCMHVSFGGNVWPFYVGRSNYRFTY